MGGTSRFKSAVAQFRRWHAHYTAQDNGCVWIIIDFSFGCSSVFGFFLFGARFTDSSFFQSILSYGSRVQRTCHRWSQTKVQVKKWKSWKCEVDNWCSKHWGREKECQTLWWRMLLDFCSIFGLKKGWRKHKEQGFFSKFQNRLHSRKIYGRLGYLREISLKMGLAKVGGRWERPKWVEIRKKNQCLERRWKVCCSWNGESELIAKC